MLDNLFPASTSSAHSSDPKQLQREILEMRVKDFNKTPGNFHADTGYHCPVCNDHGVTAGVFDDSPDGWPRFGCIPCKCVKTRSALLKMKRSGLGNIIREKTFGHFQDNTDWRRSLKAGAVSYTQKVLTAKEDDPKGWFFMGGQPGSGKSHIGAAISRELLLKQFGVYYMIWPTESKQIHGLAKSDDGHREREKLLDTIKSAEVLYIDDLFKPIRERGQKIEPTPADIKLAFEIINERYTNPQLATVISSEWHMDELLEIDEATASRIFEMAGDFVFNIANDPSRNFRLRKAEML